MRTMAERQLAELQAAEQSPLPAVPAKSADAPDERPSTRSASWLDAHVQAE